MNDEHWVKEYIEWKSLKPFQVKLLEEGAQSQSQAWLINSMWCEWLDLKKLRNDEHPKVTFKKNHDPWEPE